jgi:L-Ala-D/L-Glu epimerase
VIVTCRPLTIPFAVAFRHASADRRETAAIWVEARDGELIGFGEGCPRPYVTGETVESALAFVAVHQEAVSRAVVDLPSLRAWMAAHGDEIDRHPAAWCALELALLDLLAKRAGVTVDALLGLPPLAPVFRYTAVLGIAAEPAFSTMVRAYAAKGFADYKLKLSGDVREDGLRYRAIADVAGARIRVDANNRWSGADEAIAALRALPGTPIGIEEPIDAGNVVGLMRIADSLGVPVVMDESVTRVWQVMALPPPADQWIVNVRVSKMGGLLRSLEVVRLARERGLRIIVGAQVGETSLLTRVGLTVATAAGTLLVGQEGAFGTRLLTRDVCDPPLMFGAGGVLRWADHPGAVRTGFGLAVSAA